MRKKRSTSKKGKSKRPIKTGTVRGRKTKSKVPARYFQGGKKF